ncbi:trehalose synthase (ADP-glucose) [Hydrogenivirga caldilitoris]|uniref:Trehalose synthase (ADP-glucose) n=1 Tax=Hydrogenivirga caldilitoris TaxID=246264 RepID=A0A497XQ65_9AQUI|nr:glycosyltransferase [Hydrogenivirga caldilitoris]RLJ70269.1 trehalose synthase (ADP-glucose) [Hydrogenivirga caldilitoris]
MLEEYTKYIDEGTLSELKQLAQELKGVKILHVNSTKLGGGVAEILHRMVPLMNELGIETRWEVIKGELEFFKVTKKIHNLLHMPGKEALTHQDVITYMRQTYENVSYIDTDPYDVVFIHDPQPLGLIVKKRKGQRWVWRCHIDISTPDEGVWKFLEMFVNGYDGSIFHIPEFVREGVQIPAFVIPPSIDPLHDKNIELSEEFINSVLERFGIDPEKPIILQVSRFDRLKDPLGVMEAYKLVKRRYDCQLVLAGSFAADDPEGEEVYKEVMEAKGDDKDVFILNLPPDSHKEINALQRAATVVVQKSIREGFGLVVSEAMWKYKPVVGSNIGGIKRQIVNGVTGYLVNSVEGTAFRIKQLLANVKDREEMGKNAHERVRHSFLITRHISDYLLVTCKLLKP